MINKYNNISWWYIFDTLDKLCHKVAIEEFKKQCNWSTDCWIECVTSSAEIKYFKQIKELYEVDLVTVLNQTKKTIVIQAEIKWVVNWIFTFVKI
jgi:hypothetical protein